MTPAGAVHFHHSERLYAVSGSPSSSVAMELSADVLPETAEPRSIAFAKLSLAFAVAR